MVRTASFVNEEYQIKIPKKSPAAIEKPPSKLDAILDQHLSDEQTESLPKKRADASNSGLSEPPYKSDSPDIGKSAHKTKEFDVSKISEEELKNLSESDRLIFRKLQESSINPASSTSWATSAGETGQSEHKNCSHLLKLIKAFINYPSERFGEKDSADTDSKESAPRERSFQLFNQKYKVALTFSSPLLKEKIQAVRTQSLSKKTHSAVHDKLATPSDKSYSHASK